MKFNITLQELKAAVKFAENKGQSEFKTITMTISDCGGIGNRIEVAPSWNGEQKNITNYDGF